MPTIRTRPTTKFLSRPDLERAGNAPFIYATALGWAIALCGIAGGALTVQSQPVYGYLLLMLGLGLACYLGMVSYGVFRQSRERHELVLDTRTITLITIDKKSNRRKVEGISFNAITGAEYYPGKGSAELSLHTRDGVLEIPLWAFGVNAEQQVLEHLKMSGVGILSVPTEIIV